MIIALSGRMMSGKDEAAKRLVSKHRFKRLAYADQLKRIALTLMGVDYDEPCDKNELIKRWGKTKRQIWQDLGVAIRNVHPDIWAEYVHHDLELYDNVVITDLRFLNEARLAKRHGAKLVRINRPGLKSSSQHSSETDLDKYDKWDAIIVNDGCVSDLHDKVDRLIEDMTHSPMQKQRNHVTGSSPRNV